MAAALQGTTIQGILSQRRGNKRCFKCGSLGRFKSDCPDNRGAISGQSVCSPGTCPKCRKGNHWVRGCKSKTNIQGRPVGKREEGPTPGPDSSRTDSLWGNTAAAEPRKSIFELARATPGSAGLDLCSAFHAVLTPEMGVQILPTGVFGPLPEGTWGLLLG